MKYKIKTALVTLFFMLVIVSPVSAQSDSNPVDWGLHPLDHSNVGTVGWQFLKLHTNARSAAMGGLVSSIDIDGANSALANPASLVNIENIGVAFNNLNWVADISYNSFGAVKSLGDYGSIGLNMIYVDYGEEIRTEYMETQLVSGVTYTPVLDGLGTVGAHDMAVGLTYAKRITDKLKVGGSIRYLEEKIDDAKTSTWSIDLGTVFYTGYRSLRITMLGRNFGPDAEFKEYNDRIQKVPFSVRLPMQLILGTAMDVVEKGEFGNHNLLLAVDYLIPNDGEQKLNVGAEYSFADVLFLRAGYKMNYDEENLTFGAGLNYMYGETGMNVDYAYIDVGLFGEVHMFTIGLQL